MKKTSFYIAAIIIVLTSCNPSNKTERKISKINAEFEFVEFHKDFFNSNEENLEKLKNKYPFLFPSNIDNKEWIEKINNSEEKQLFNITDSTFNNLTEIKDELKDLYKHVKFYNSNFKSPKTFSIINNLDYENPIIYADTLAFISLDMYLGKDSEVYESFPKYISQNYTPENISVDLAKEIIERNYIFNRERSFLGSMIYYGKKSYLLKCLLPKKSENLILGTSQEKFNWAIENESQIWKYFISNEMLFSTDQALNKRFIDTAPFSKFYLETDKESPGQIGIFIGLKIITSFMKNNSYDLNQMTSLNASEILQLSKYKPKK